MSEPRPSGTRRRSRGQRRRFNELGANPNGDATPERDEQSRPRDGAPHLFPFIFRYEPGAAATRPCYYIHARWADPYVHTSRKDHYAAQPLLRPKILKNVGLQEKQIALAARGTINEPHPVRMG